MSVILLVVETSSADNFAIEVPENKAWTITAVATSMPVDLEIDDANSHNIYHQLVGIEGDTHSFAAVEAPETRSYGSKSTSPLPRLKLPSGVVITLNPVTADVTVYVRLLIEEEAA